MFFIFNKRDLVIIISSALEDIKDFRGEAIFFFLLRLIITRLEY